jgi:hypothetical protein
MFVQVTVGVWASCECVQGAPVWLVCGHRCTTLTGMTFTDERTRTMTTPARALYCPDQTDADADTLADMDRRGMLLSVAAWVAGSPVVTMEAFASFASARAADDRNGNWGHVFPIATADAGRVMCYQSADDWAASDEDTWPRDGMTVAAVRDALGCESWAWVPGDGGAYRLADAIDWADWAPVVPATSGALAVVSA